MPTRILVVDDSELNLKLVTATLKTDGYEIVTARDGREALEIIKELPPALAILDVIMPDMDGFTLCQRFRKEPQTSLIPIMILTALARVEDKIKAFDSGADGFMAKPFEPQELRARVKVLLHRFSEQAPARVQDVVGKVIAVYSLRGGVGVSTLAANLAAGLAQIWGVPSVLADMVFLSGQSALLFDLPLRNTWADMSRAPSEEIDADMLERVMLQHQSGVRILASPRRPEEAEVITVPHVRRTIELLRKQYHYILLDLPHDFSGTTLAGLDMADQILLMLAPELASVRCAANALATFEKLEYPKENISLALNWIFKGKGLPRKEMENALGREINVVIPYAGDALVTAITLGKPPVLQSPLEPLGAFLEDLAYLFSKEEHKKNPPDGAGEGLKRVKERAQARQAKAS